MKILHVADFHADHDFYAWGANAAQKYDLLVIAGDLIDMWVRGVSYHEQARAIRRWLVELQTPSLVVSGNHDFWVSRNDTIDAQAEGSWVRNLRGQGKIAGVDSDDVVIGGIKFCCHGWMKRWDLGKKCDVLVTHAPPAGTSTSTTKNGRDHGDPEVRDMQHMPRLILSGHVHSPTAFWHRWPAVESLVLNPGHDGHASEPLHWIIDTDHGVATHSLGDVVRFGRLP